LNIFQEYAAYYDLLYQDRDFAREATFVHRLIQLEMPGAISLLDLGCGTGAHAAILAEMGYSVHGIDQSSQMLALADRRRQALAPEVCARLCFEQNDLRTLRLNKTFDVIVLLFHVMSYQISDADLRAAFVTIATHLNSNGIVLFDFWYGPAVLADPPLSRNKVFEDEKFKISRVAISSMHAYNLVDVNYKITATEKASSKSHEFTECHRMRYLFKPELDLFLREAGLLASSFGEWITGRPPDCGTWNVFVSATRSYQQSR
jgi:SAM-dependent methyltransferase